MARDEAGAEAPPLVLAVEGRHGPVVHATSRGAEALGVRIGARLVDARALAPELVVDYADPAGDAAALSRLMLWVRRWCPWTAIDGSGAAALLLDTTGSDHLHGGEEALLREIEDRLAGLGLSSRLALAPTPGAAWALARHTGPRTRCLPDGLAQALAPLPVEALRLGEGTVLTLQRLGLSTIGALAAVPRLSLARRFGRTALEDNPLLRLDQAMGTLAEPLSSPEEPPRFAAQARLAEPVLDPVPHLPSLAQDLCADLAAEGFGARRLRLTLYRTDGLVTRAEAATARPSREAGHLLRLFDERLERLDPGYGFDLIALEAIVAEALGARQHALGGGREEAADLARLIDRLSARFGAPALTRPALIESHLPERQSRWIPALAGTPGAFPAALILRPLRLFDPPEEVRVLYAVPEGPPAQFSWRRQTWRIARFAGPERIAPEWWTDRPGTRLRDYYRIEEQTGRRFWLYREGLLGDGRGEGPRWFLHGAFA
ncbi:Y-family DNA polymerase [Pseudoroseicyclus aestuarii]|uniref:Protein ImuB n=1 Tax=Pseudoroseicyclus aestuarii TaxID=1795041 RepID=A0A318SMC9_9RHOB|nr:DNA polymerase Y family protein [Pseudoroseicyclus aestuarii]PYE81190.1 protein ImuB [Pseudoroseicyclus aestuarii]